MPDWKETLNGLKDNIAHRVHSVPQQQQMDEEIGQDEAERFGHEARARRERIGITQRSFAQAAGIPESSYSSIESYGKGLTGYRKSSILNMLERFEAGDPTLAEYTKLRTRRVIGKRASPSPQVGKNLVVGQAYTFEGADFEIRGSAHGTEWQVQIRQNNNTLKIEGNLGDPQGLLPGLVAMLNKIAQNHRG